MRFCREPLSRKIEQPLPTFTTLNKVSLPYLTHFPLQTIQKLAAIFPNVRRYQQFLSGQMASKPVYRLNIRLTQTDLPTAVLVAKM